MKAIVLKQDNEQAKLNETVKSATKSVNALDAKTALCSKIIKSKKLMTVNDTAKIEFALLTLCYLNEDATLHLDIVAPFLKSIDCYRTTVAQHIIDCLDCNRYDSNIVKLDKRDLTIDAKFLELVFFSSMHQQQIACYTPALYALYADEYVQECHVLAKKENKKRSAKK